MAFELAVVATLMEVRMVQSAAITYPQWVSTESGIELTELRDAQFPTVSP